MKSVRFLLPLLLLLAATPLLAAERTVDLAGWVVWADPNSEGTFDTSNDQIDVNFDGEMGYGASVNIFWGSRFSTEFAVSQIDLPIALTSRPRAVGVQDTNANMIPVTGVLQWHLAPDAMLDPYIGAGAAYILFGNVTKGEAGNLALDDIDSDDLGLVINAGLSIALNENLGINLDAKYVPVGSAARGVLNDANGTETDIEINPIIFSAGLAWRF